MKHLIIIMFALLMLTAAAPEVTFLTPVGTSEFCDGFADGFTAGWQDVKGQFAIAPPTPVCPVAGVGQENYKGGYNAGFKAGRKKANPKDE